MTIEFLSDLWMTEKNALQTKQHQVKSMNDISGKTAIVTGGGSGIGFAIAKSLIENGVNVVLASRRRDLLDASSKELNAMQKGRAVGVRCDLRNKKDVLAVVQKTKKYFPSIDILINNSGLGVTPKIVDCTDEEWNMVMDTNLTGAFWMTREVLPTMIRNRSGYIINIASQAAKHGYANAGPYCASKFGLVGLSEALQVEVREYGIHVHSLCPALVQVPPPKNKKEMDNGVLQVDDLASTVLFLLKQPKRIKYENIGLYRF